jgi:hypothetical protein
MLQHEAREQIGYEKVAMSCVHARRRIGRPKCHLWVKAPKGQGWRQGPYAKVSRGFSQDTLGVWGPPGTPLVRLARYLASTTPESLKTQDSRV